MAYFRAQIDDAFMQKLVNLGERREAVIQLMLDDGAQILQDVIEKEIRDKHTKNDHLGSGELADSIETFEPYLSKNGIWIAGACPTGRSVRKLKKGKVYKRSKSGTVSSGRALYNSDKLWFIEKGTSKQTARPFIDRVCKNVEEKIVENMRKIYDREAAKM